MQCYIIVHFATRPESVSAKTDYHIIMTEQFKHAHISTGKIVNIVTEVDAVMTGTMTVEDAQLDNVNIATIKETDTVTLAREA